MGSIVLFFNRTRHDPAANIVVDGRTCNNLFILQFGRQIIQIFAYLRSKSTVCSIYRPKSGISSHSGRRKRIRCFSHRRSLPAIKALSYDIVFPPASLFGTQIAKDYTAFCILYILSIVPHFSQLYYSAGFKRCKAHLYEIYAQKSHFVTLST